MRQRNHTYQSLVEAISRDSRPARCIVGPLAPFALAAEHVLLLPPIGPFTDVEVEFFRLGCLSPHLGHTLEPLDGRPEISADNFDSFIMAELLLPSFPCQARCARSTVADNKSVSCNCMGHYVD